jgi:hypothetical protein
MPASPPDCASPRPPNWGHVAAGSRSLPLRLFSVSRLYVGAHLPLDVVGGAAPRPSRGRRTRPSRPSRARWVSQRSSNTRRSVKAAYCSCAPCSNRSRTRLSTRTGMNLVIRARPQRSGRQAQGASQRQHVDCLGSPNPIGGRCSQMPVTSGQKLPVDDPAPGRPRQGSERRMPSVCDLGL